MLVQSYGLVLAPGHTRSHCPFIRTILQTQEDFAAEPKFMGNHFAPLSIRLGGNGRDRVV